MTTERSIAAKGMNSSAPALFSRIRHPCEPVLFPGVLAKCLDGFRHMLLQLSLLLCAASLPILRAADSIPLAIALDAPELVFTTDPEAAGWVGQTDVSLDGSSSAYLAETMSEAWIETTVTGPGVISFWWAHHGSMSYYNLHFYVDGQQVAGDSDFTGWREISAEIPAGSHVLRWSSWGGSGIGWSWLDQLRFSPVGSPASFTSPSQTRVVGTNAVLTLRCFARGTPPLRYQWSRNGVAIPDATNATWTLWNAQPSHAGPYQVAVTNAFGGGLQEVLVVVTNGALAELLDTVGLTVRPNYYSSALWHGTTNTYVSGDSAVEFYYQGPDAAGGSDALESIVEGPGTLTFWWKVLAGVGRSASMQFSTYSSDWTAYRALWETGEWRQETVYVPAGPYGVVWFFGDESWSGVTPKKGWLDQVEFAPGGTPHFVLSQPQSATIARGGLATFSVGAEGTPPLSFQWRMDGTNIPGAEYREWTVENPGPCRSNVIDCVVANDYGVTHSQPALLRVMGCPGDPLIEFTCVPFINSCMYVHGRVLNVVFSNYLVAPFIQAWIGWWNKPTWATRTVPIDPATGLFSFWYCTGGVDSTAGSMAVFLIDRSYDPPLVGGDRLPEDILRNCADYAIISRTLQPTLQWLGQTNGDLVFTVQGSMGHTCAIDMTEALGPDAAGTRWVPLNGSTNTYEREFIFRYPQPAGAGQRFFRARALPCP